MSLTNESISVVIPSIGRRSLQDALASVYSQTLVPDEVIVCNDSESALDLKAFPDVKVLSVGPRAGGNNARIAGMRQANGAYIALLDDDDAWTPDHLERLHRLVATNAENDVWIASSTGVLADGSQYPVRIKDSSESLSEYLFVLKGFGSGAKGALSTSTLLFPAALVELVPWRSGLRFHQDLTWMLDVENMFPRIAIWQDAAATVTFGDTPGSVSKSISVRDSVAWAESEMLSTQREKVYIDFLLTRYPLRAAATHGGVSDILFVCKSALSAGSPSRYSASYALAYMARSLYKRLNSGFTEAILSLRKESASI